MNSPKGYEEFLAMFLAMTPEAQGESLATLEMMRRSAERSEVDDQLLLVSADTIDFGDNK